VACWPVSLQSFKGPFINNVRAPREGWRLEKSLYTLTWEGANWDSYVMFSKSIFYIK